MKYIKAIWVQIICISCIAYQIIDDPEHTTRYIVVILILIMLACAQIHSLNESDRLIAKLSKLRQQNNKKAHPEDFKA